MSGERPFVVTVASEKGGVGKTTLATNLAVYLKALREDLPVTIVSFDNHFSVDNMFAIGDRSGRSVAGLFRGEPLEELVQLGEYGVQYLASERLLIPLQNDPHVLKAALRASQMGGVLIIDTRPIIDYFTHSALIAADLLLVPVKDRPSLVNAAAVVDTFAAGGGERSSAWLVPSLIDSRLRLRGEIGVREFLTFSARERGYQVLDTYIAKSPKVESLATNLTSRIYPVLTHARNTVVHQQFREIADFALKTRDSYNAAPVNDMPPVSVPAGRLRRLVRECPVCGSLNTGEVHYLHDQRSRRHGAIHASCLKTLLEDVDADDWLDLDGAMLMFDAGDAGLTGPADAVVLRLFSGTGEEIHSRSCSFLSVGAFESFLRATSGRVAEEFFRDRLFVTSYSAPLVQHLEDGLFRLFHDQRKRIVKAAFDGRSAELW